MIPGAIIVLDHLPLTPNGKIDRKALPSPEGSQPSVRSEYEAPRNQVERILASLWSQVLRVERIGIHDNFFELGGDSILGLRIVARAQQANLEFSVSQLFESQTIAELAGKAIAAPSSAEITQKFHGPVPLTPIARWFFEQNFTNPHHWNQAVVIHSAARLDEAAFENALSAVLERHDAFRMRFECTTEGWKQIAGEFDFRNVFQRSDLSGVAEADLAAALEANANQAQSGLNLERGPLIRVVWSDLGDRGIQILMVAHHLIIDGVSWRILFDELATAYEQSSRGESLRLSPPTMPLSIWAERLWEYATSEETLSSLSHWTGVERLNANPLPIDFPGMENTEGSAQTIIDDWSPEQTRDLLQLVPRVCHTHINDVLLTALAQALGLWSGNNTLLINLEGHGREELGNANVSRTVGWFTTMCPVPLDWNAAKPVRDRLQEVKERLRAIPHRGLSYGLLRYGNDKSVREQLAALPQPEISFNYLGQFDETAGSATGWKGSEHGSGHSHSADAARPFLLDVTAMVSDGKLRVSFSYSANLHESQSIRELSDHYRAALNSILDHAIMPDHSVNYSAADFPLADLNEEDLEELMSDLPKQS